MVQEIVNKNMLNPTGFTFNIKRIPSLNFMVQAVSLPGITLGDTFQPTPFKLTPIPGDHIAYSELDVRFKVTEDLANYIAVYSWIKGLGFPNNFEEYKALALNDANFQIGEGLVSDCTLLINTSSRNPSFRVEIADAFPVSLTPLEMNTIDTNIDYVEATVSFRFRDYRFIAI